MVRGERQGEGAMKEADKRRGGARGWGRNEDQGQPERGGVRAGGGDLVGRGIDLRVPRSNRGKQLTYILQSHV